MYDPRAIANLILDAADRYGFEVSNLKLQKLLFFAYCRYLVDHQKSLITGNFEAWQHGPVHSVVYQAFKTCEGSTIKHRSERFDPVTREYLKLELPTDPCVLIAVDRTVLEFGSMSASKLVKLTHVKDGAWDSTIKQSRFEGNLGLKISNEMIIRTLKRQLMVISTDDEGTEPSENAPFT